MTERKSLTFCLMDAPFEQARTTTAFRLVDRALREGFDVDVFAYEGAAALSFAAQARHPNAVHGHDVEQEDHPRTRDWVVALFELAASLGARLTWVNCGLCVDERGVGDFVPGVVRGSPADLHKMAATSLNTLVIPTR